MSCCGRTRPKLLIIHLRRGCIQVQCPFPCWIWRTQGNTLTLADGSSWNGALARALLKKACTQNNTHESRDTDVTWLTHRRTGVFMFSWTRFKRRDILVDNKEFCAERFLQLRLKKKWLYTRCEV